MSVVRINAIAVAEGGGGEPARRFAARARAVDQADGFDGFELLRPIDARTTWLVVTRWQDAQAFEAWASSPDFDRGHRQVCSGEECRTQRPPVTASSELWAYDPVDSSHHP